MIKGWKNEYGEFLRFCIVGAFCTGLDACIFYVVSIFVVYYIALICGYIVSLIVNYYLTIFWTFKCKPNTKNAIGVVLAHLFNLFVVRMGLMWLFTSYMFLSDKIAYVPTLLISVVTNFLIVRYVVRNLYGQVEKIGNRSALL